MELVLEDESDHKTVFEYNTMQTQLVVENCETSRLSAPSPSNTHFPTPTSKRYAEISTWRFSHHLPPFLSSIYSLDIFSPFISLLELYILLSRTDVTLVKSAKLGNGYETVNETKNNIPFLLLFLAVSKLLLLAGGLPENSCKAWWDKNSYTSFVKGLNVLLR